MKWYQKLANYLSKLKIDKLQNYLCRKQKHYWTGHWNKHGQLYRRSCPHCGAYQNLVKGKWVGYADLKLHSGKKQYNGKNKRF